jgi:hypothetical protein
LKKATDLDDAASRAANDSPNATYQYHLGMALKAKGDKDGSRHALETALRLAQKRRFPYEDDAKKALATM